MKTKKQVIKENPQLKWLINAVIDRIGMESIEDVNRHGLGGGFNGFIYTSDTHAFAMRYRKEILWLLDQQADDLNNGDVVAMVSSFGVFRNSPMGSEDRKDLYRYLGGASCEQSTITNLMAWYAAEEICRLFED